MCVVILVGFEYPGNVCLLPVDTVSVDYITYMTRDESCVKR